MDLSFSPDLPAWVCYLIVFVFGALTGWREIVEKIGTPGVWKHGATWALMFILALSPVVLFWILDRSGAINDTSVLAAVVIGIAYTQILKGESGYKAPGSTSPIWDFLGWWRERIGKTLLTKSGANALAFDVAVCEQLADAQKLPDAILLAQRLAPDPVKFNADLATEQQRLAGANPPLAPNVVDFKTAEIAYREILADPNGRKLLVDSKLIDKKLVDRHFTAEWENYVGVVGTVVIFVVIAWGTQLDTARGVTVGHWVERQYMNYRLEKQTSSPVDLARVTGELMYHFKTAADTHQARFWLEPFKETLRSPTLPMPRLDATILVLLSARESGKLTTPEIAETFVYSLRNNNVDARRRIQAALVYLAAHPSQQVSDTLLVRWNPTEGDSVPQIEEYIDRWRAVWAARAGLRTASTSG